MAHHDLRKAESIVQRQVDAYNNRDINAFVATYKEDAVIYEHFGDTVVATGHEAIRRQWGQVFIDNPLLQCRVINRICLGNTIVDHEEVSGAYGQQIKAIVVYNVCNNLIQKVWLIETL